jgi:hypothetical protein
MDSITLIIAGLSGFTIGVPIGMYLCALFAQRKIQRAGAESWRSAERFYKSAYILTPKN